jgi:hypothetical protein
VIMSDFFCMLYGNMIAVILSEEKSRKRYMDTVYLYTLLCGDKIVQYASTERLSQQV